jgi:hypothetical protein
VGRDGTRVAVAAVAVGLAATGCLPLEVGSAGSALGNDLAGAPGCIDAGSGCGGAQPELSAVIAGPYTSRTAGDPYGTTCLGAPASTTSCDATGANPDHRPEGTTYAVEVAAAGQVVTVELYDAVHYRTGVADNHTGDRVEPAPVGTGTTTSFELFAEDGNAYAAKTTPELSMAGDCTAGPGQAAFAYDSDEATYHNRWTTLCSFTAPAKGVYPLVVRASGGGGTNGFSVRATATSGTQPVVHANDDLTLHVEAGDGTWQGLLAEIGSSNRGKILVVDLFDLGDEGGGTASASLAAPDGSVPPCFMSWGEPGMAQGGVTNVEFLEVCEFPTRTVADGARFDDRWLRLSVDLPGDYACGAACWWSVHEDVVGGDVVDTTTWAVRVEEPAEG